MPLPDSNCIEAEVWEDVCRPRETFVAVVVSEVRWQDVIVTPCADPTKDVLFGLVLHDDKVSRAARESTIKHVVSGRVRPPSSMVFTVIRGGGMHGASHDLSGN